MGRLDGSVRILLVLAAVATCRPGSGGIVVPPDAPPGAAVEDAEPEAPLVVREIDLTRFIEIESLADEEAEEGGEGSRAASQPSGEPTPFAVDSAPASDPADARGHLMGGAVGNALGVGGLAMFGAGEGGGGSNVTGFGLADVGAMGHGYGTGDGVGFGRGGGRMGAGGGGDTSGGVVSVGGAASGPDPSGRSGRAPELRLGDATTFGGMSREVIRRIVQQHRGRLRHCYEAALRAEPTTAGRVSVRFVISPQGAVSSVQTTGDSTGSDDLVSCVESVVARMSFPQADGTTAVTYPFQFQPDETWVIAQEGAAEGEEGPPPPTQGALRAKSADGSWVGEFPLEHTDVRGEIGGYLARTVVAQTFGNPFREPIEAVYAFPLPASAAVNDFVMEVGGRTIVGIVRPREEAERIYEEARAQGRTASLLSQERPNLFTEQVANIAAGESVTVKITFFERLIPEKGRYEWVFPMVVGPRYVPGTPRPAAAEGRAGAGGTSPPTTVVRDADRITPPVLRDGERSGHDIALEVTLDAGLPLRNLTSVAHRVSVREPSASKRVVKLSEADGIPNRDFVLRWEVDGEETRFGVVSHRADDGGYLTLMVQPPTAPSDAQAVPREITFIIDVSGSMSGIPLDLSKALVRRVLDSLRPDDAFNVHYFASGSGQLWPTPREKTAENVRAARQYLDGLGSGGGTEMFEGLRRSLGAQHDPRRVQMYVFLTDGFVGDEERILRLVESDRGEARFFAFGIGSSVNRYLIDGIGAVGGGASRMLLPRDPDAVETAAAGLFALIDSPVLVDVAIDWNGLPVSDVYPSKLPDLFAGGTLDVVARYDRPATGTIYVTARSGSERVRIPVAVVLPEREEANAALAPVWARWRIADLEGELRAAEDENARKAVAKRITDLAVDYRLASAFTSFVAVDEERVVGDGRPLRVMQPVEVPEDVSREGAVGERPEREAIRIPVWGLTLATGAGGSVRVYAVDPGSPADRAGIAVGATVRTVNRTAVHDMAHLEGLLVQHAASARLGLDPGGEVSLPAP